MPFTPFHLGPAMALGWPLRRRIHLPTLLFSSIIVDVEPFFVIVFGLDYPLHGYLHTFLASIFLGSLFGFLCYRLGGGFEGFWRRLDLVPILGVRPSGYVLAGFIGWFLHVLFDSPLYSDIRPFYPRSVNSLYAPELVMIDYGVCMLLGVIGVSMYFYQRR